MDDDDEREFSRAIVFGFMEQAEQTFTEMEDHLYVLSPPEAFERSLTLACRACKAKQRTLRNSRGWDTS